MFALKTFAQYDKKVTLSQNALKELYLVVLGAATIPNNATDYVENSTYDLASYLTVQSVYGTYGNTLSNTTSGCYGGAYSGGFARCKIKVSPFSLPIATSSTVTYLLSVTAPNPTEFILNAGESTNPNPRTCAQSASAIEKSSVSIFKSASDTPLAAAHAGSTRRHPCCK